MKPSLPACGLTGSLGNDNSVFADRDGVSWVVVLILKIVVENLELVGCG
jgi:hypothetical protein